MTKVFTKNGEVLTVNLNSVKKAVEFLQGEGVKLVASTEGDINRKNRILITAINAKNEEKSIGYVKNEEEITAAIGEGNTPEIGEITVVSVNENDSKVFSLVMTIELKNSLAFLEKENADILVKLVTSTLLFSNSASTLEAITEEINQFGKVNVTGIKKNDKLVAVYKNVAFATIKADDDVQDSLIELANANQLVLSLNERDGSSFNGKVVKPKELAIMNITQEIEKISKVIVDRGILTEEQVQQRIDYMNGAESIRKNQVLKALEFLNTITDEEIPHLIIPEKPETLFIDYDGIMGDILDGIFVGDNICLAGPKSVGKNVAVETTSWLFLLPIGEITLNPQTTNENLYGAPNVKNDNGVPVTEFEMSALVAAFSGEKTRFAAGGISLADEINAAPSATMMPMQAAYDWRQHIEIPNYKKVHKHRRSISFSTMNPGYLAMKPLNEAIADRFNTTIFMENGIDFYKVLERQYGEELDVELAKKLALLYKKFFDMVNEAALDFDSDVEIDDKVLSIRGFKSAYEKISNGQDFTRAIRNSVINKVTDREIREGLFEVVNDTFSK